MTVNQIAWAASHDWFDRFDNGVLYVTDSYVTADGVSHEDHIAFEGSFSDLRNFAGY